MHKLFYNYPNLPLILTIAVFLGLTAALYEKQHNDAQEIAELKQASE